MSHLLKISNIFIDYLTSFQSITLTFRSRCWYGGKDMTLVTHLSMNFAFLLCNKDQYVDEEVKMSHLLKNKQCIRNKVVGHDMKTIDSDVLL